MAILQVPSEFPTIAAAQAAAGPGDTIVVDEAYGSETVTIQNDGLTINAEYNPGGLTIRLAEELTGGVIVVQGSRPFKVIGNDTENFIDATATAGAVLYGEAGDDFLMGSDEADRLIGGLGNDQIYGYHGNDVLISNEGAPFDDHDTDVMYGGMGDDVYRIDGEDDEAIEQVGEGIDRVYIVNDFALTAGSEVEIIQWRGGSNPVTITGNEFANRIVGSTMDDTLNGGEGNDVLVGGDGSDTLNGGIGNDVLISNNGHPFDDFGTDVLSGGLGDDVYRVDGENDQVIEQAGEGLDRVQVTNSFTLAAGSEVEIIQWRGGFNPVTITGNEFANRISGSFMDDTLNGGGGNDVLDGSGGNDALNGGDGNDVMFGGSGQDSFDGGDGIDTVSFLRSPFAANVDLAAQLILNDADSSFGESIVNVENLVGSNSSDILRGDSGDNRLDGRGGDDMLRGNGGNDTILGREGMDQITGGAGADRLFGGADNDTFIYTGTGDSTVASEGRDIIADFVQGADTISLSQIDADAAASDNQAFSFVGANAFSNTAGELRHAAAGANTLIEGDVDGDGAADFSILLKGTYSLGSGDFSL